MLLRLRVAQERGSGQNPASPVISNCFTCLSLIKKHTHTHTKPRHLLHATPKSPCEAQPGSVGRFLSRGPVLGRAPRIRDHGVTSGERSVPMLRALATLALRSGSLAPAPAA